MRRQILCTVGTSLLTNRDGRLWCGWDPRNGDPLPAYNEVDRWLKEADTTAASAETNTLARLDLAESDILVLLHSDTPEGLFCAERLKAFYEGRVRETILARIGKLGYGPPSLPRGSRPSWMQ